MMVRGSACFVAPCGTPQHDAEVYFVILRCEPSEPRRMKIIATDRKGEVHTLEGRDGWSVMEILRDAGLPVAAECGGACACATCQVYVDPEWYEKLPPKSDAETDMLDMAVAVEPNSRLSCQITCVPTLDGLKLTIAPE